jgi:hypothetical protein
MAPRGTVRIRGKPHGRNNRRLADGTTGMRNRGIRWAGVRRAQHRELRERARDHVGSVRQALAELAKSRGLGGSLPGQHETHHDRSGSQVAFNHAVEIDPVVAEFAIHRPLEMAE